MVPVAATVSMFARAYQSLAQFQALAGLLQSEPERDVSDPAVSLAPVRGAVRVAGLAHTFAGSGAPSLAGLTFSIREGERVALEVFDQHRVGLFDTLDLQLHDRPDTRGSAEGLAEFDQTFRDKGPLPFRRIGPGPEFRLGDIER